MERSGEEIDRATLTPQQFASQIMALKMNMLSLTEPTSSVHKRHLLSEIERPSRGERTPGREAASEQAAEGDEEFAAAGVADGAADGDGAERRGSDQAGGPVLAENCARFGGPYLAGLVADDAVQSMAIAGGQRGQAAKIAGAG